MAARGKRIAIAAGIGAVALLGIAGLYWKQILYGIHPEARLWGRWRQIESADRLPSNSIGIAFRFRLNRRFHEAFTRQHNTGNYKAMFHKGSVRLIKNKMRLGEIFFWNEMGYLQGTSRFWFEDEDTLILEDREGFFFEFCRVLPDN